jgi:hypothetical protein
MTTVKDQSPGFLIAWVMSIVATHGGFDWLLIRRDMKMVYIYILSIIVGVLMMDLFIAPMIIFFIGASCYHFGRDFEYLSLDPNYMLFGVMLVTGTVLAPPGSETPFHITGGDKPGLWIWFNTLESLGMEELAMSKITEICMVIWIFTIVFLFATMKPKLVTLCLVMILATSTMTLPFIGLAYMGLVHIPIAIRSVELTHGSFPVTVWLLISILGSRRDVVSLYTDHQALRFGIPIVTVHVITNFLWEKRWI